MTTSHATMKLRHPRPGEIQWKHWLVATGTALGIGPTGVQMRISRGRMPRPPTRIVSKRLIYVTT